jgi:hypothetical protein
MLRNLFHGIVFTLVIVNQGAAQLDSDNVQTLLDQEIIGEHLAMAEVQDFNEARVPLIPEFKSVEEWETYAQQIRQDVLNKVYFRGAAAEWRKVPTRFEWMETINAGSGYRIKQLRFEALPGMWIPALLYEPTKLDGKVPVIMNVNGHEGVGLASDYKQRRCINQAKRGMLALSLEYIGLGQLRTDDNQHYRQNQLDLCGTSGVAPFYLAMERGIDILLQHEHADPERLAVAGLSGGGWQTIVISSLDTRVRLSNPVAGYSSYRTRVRFLTDLGDSEQTPSDLATVADYTHLTAMLAPRAALLTYNETDNCCFAAPHALPPLLAAAQPIYELYGQPDRLRSHVNYDPGDHNFGSDNREALHRMLRDNFFAPGAEFNVTDIAADDEIKTPEQLHVTLPEGNATFHSLAMDLSQPLPRDADLPADEAIEAWRSDARQRLSQLVNAHPYECKSRSTASDTIDDVIVKQIQFRIGDTWTVPAVEFTPPDVQGTAIVISDQGRTSTTDAVLSRIQQGLRVLAVDPFYFGESKIKSLDYLQVLLMACVGERALGIQASQLAAISRWSTEEYDHAADVIAYGPRVSAIATVAAALEENALATVELHHAYGSLKQVIEQNLTVESTPELFCFGLLQQFDLLQITALVAPRPVTIIDAEQRVRSEMEPLQDWYARLGSEHVPLP